MKLKVMTGIIFILMTLTINAQDKVFERIKDKTWFEENGFAGESMVFIKSDSDVTQVIRQVHGSGLPVVFTEIQDVEFHGDSIFIFRNGRKVYYLSNDEGIIGLRILFKEPIIWVATENRKFLDTQLNVNTVTNFSFKSNEVYVNDKVYRINPETR